MKSLDDPKLISKRDTWFSEWICTSSLHIRYEQNQHSNLSTYNNKFYHLMIFNYFLINNMNSYYNIVILILMDLNLLIYNLKNIIKK